MGPAVEEVALLVQDYNALPAEATYQDRFAALRRIDSTAYHVFQQHPTPELSNLNFAAELRALLQATEAAHADLVDELRVRTANDEEGHLPLDASALGDDEKAEASALWSSLARGQGDLRVGGSDEFRKETFGGLAKLMQHPLGRRLVGFLDRRAEPGADGQAPPDRSVLVRESQNDPNAGARDVTQGDMNEVGPSAGPDVDPRGLVSEMLGGARGAAMGGRQFQFGAGTGVDVDMPRGLKDPRSLGPADHDGNKSEVVTPGFITLGHELGHAAKAKSGAKGNSIGFGVLPGVDPSKWSNNPEEYLNVQGVENPLRAEHGVQQRGEYTDCVKLERIAQNKRRFEAIAQQHPEQAGAILQVSTYCADKRIGDDAHQNVVMRLAEAVEMYPHLAARLVAVTEKLKFDPEVKYPAIEAEIDSLIASSTEAPGLRHRFKARVKGAFGRG